MILASRVTEYSSSTQKAGTAATKPCKGTASALADGWVHQSSQDMATDHDSPAPVRDGRLDARVVASQESLALVISELIKDVPAYQPPTLISWGSSDYQMVLLDCAWFFEEFVLLRLSHRPSVAPLGQPWTEFRAIILSDVNAIEEFRRQAGLTGTDPEEQ